MTVPLRVQQSDGPRPYTAEHVPGGVAFLSTPCRICTVAIRPDEHISYDGRAWNHSTCMTDSLMREKTAAAWRVLGSQLARRPGDFSRREVRVIVDQLLRSAADLPLLPWDTEADDQE